VKVEAADTSYVKNSKVENRKAKKKKDILHDTPVRYAGYCDDIGAAVRVICNNSNNALVRNIPVISYIPVTAYVSADVINTYNKTKKTEGKEAAKKKALSQGIYQGITSLIMPIGIVGAAQKGAGKLFDKFIPILKQGVAENGTKLVNHKRDVALALIGLGALFAVSKYADKFAKNVLMDKIINPIIGIKENKTEGVENSSKENKENADNEHLICTTQA